MVLKQNQVNSWQTDMDKRKIKIYKTKQNKTNKQTKQMTQVGNKWQM